MVKEDCIGHVQKRIGNALRWKKENSRFVCEDGKKVGGRTIA